MAIQKSITNLNGTGIDVVDVYHKIIRYDLEKTIARCTIFVQAFKDKTASDNNNAPLKQWVYCLEGDNYQTYLIDAEINDALNNLDKTIKQLYLYLKEKEAEYEGAIDV